MTTAHLIQCSKHCCITSCS